MTYSLKTAIRIVSEEDRHDLIPFFEHIRWNCNIGYWEVSQIDIGEIWFIDKEGLLTFHDKTEDLSDYTILNGVPQGWREEMKLGENIHREIADQYQGLFNLLNKEHGLILTISEMDEIVIESAKISESKIDKLESENKELKECLKNIINCIRQSGNGRNRLNDNKLGKFHAEIEQAKQLLNK